MAIAEALTDAVAQLRVLIEGEVRRFHRSVAPTAGCSIGPTSPDLIALVHQLNDAVSRANAHDAVHGAEALTADEARKEELEEVSAAICDERYDCEQQIKQAPTRSIGDLVVLAKLAEHQHLYGQMDDDMPVLLVDTILRMFAGRGFSDQADGKCADQPIDVGGHVAAGLDVVSNVDDLMSSIGLLKYDETVLLRRTTYLNHLSFIDASKLSLAMARLWSELYERDRIDQILASAEKHIAGNERLSRIWEATYDSNFDRHKEIARKIVASNPQTIGDLALQALMVWHEYQSGTPNYACAATAAERALVYAGMLPAPDVSLHDGNAPNNFAMLYEKGLMP